MPVLAFISSVFFLGTIVVSHCLKKDISFKKDALSKFALGRYGFVLSLGLYSIGLAEIVLAFILFTEFGSLLGTSSLAAAGVGSVMVAMFKMEQPKETLRGYLHVTGAVVQFFAFPLALILLADYVHGGLLYIFTLATCTLNIFLFSWIMIYVVAGTEHSVPFFGLIQKINIILMTAWVLLVSFTYIQ